MTKKSSLNDTHVYIDMSDSLQFNDVSGILQYLLILQLRNHSIEVVVPIGAMGTTQ